MSSLVKLSVASTVEKSKVRYDYRRIHTILRQSGRTFNHKTPQRLIGEMWLRGRQRRNRYKSYHGTVGAVASNSTGILLCACPTRSW